MGQTLDWLEIKQPSLATFEYKERGSEAKGALDITTRQAHFRGALLGLMFVPTAVSLTRTNNRGPGAAKRTVTPRQATRPETTTKGYQSNSISEGVGQITYCLKQISCFLSATPTSQQGGDGKTWLDAVPTLLRYHDHIKRHALWHADTATTAQYWLLSDILSQAMSRQPLNKAWLKQQVQQATQTSSTAATNRHYRWLWHTLDKTLQATLRHRKLSPQGTNYPYELLALAADNLTPHEIDQHRDVVTGITCALTAIYDEQTAPSHYHYGLSISMAAQTISANTGWEAPLMAGLVSGAIVGHSALPVWWQQPSHHPAIEGTIEAAVGISLADALFRQWAGMMIES